MPEKKSIWARVVRGSSGHPGQMKVGSDGLRAPGPFRVYEITKTALPVERYPSVESGRVAPNQQSEKAIGSFRRYGQIRKLWNP